MLENINLLILVKFPCCISKIRKNIDVVTILEKYNPIKVRVLILTFNIVSSVNETILKFLLRFL